MYGEFSTIYDLLMRGVDYDEWASYLCTLLSANGVPSGGAICECCCGTGQITVRLASAGYRQIASDSSSDMLMVARERCRREGRKVPFICQDMRSIIVHKPVHAVLACCDGVNYLTDDTDLNAFMHSSSDSLLPGGVLLFDVSSEYKLENVLGMNTFGEDEEDICYFWKNMYDPVSRLAELSLTCFVRMDGGSFRRVRETQIQRAYSIGEILKSAADSSFEAAGVYGFGTFSSPHERDERIQFVFRKKGADA